MLHSCLCFQPLLNIFQRRGTRVYVPEPSVLRTLASSRQGQAQLVDLSVGSTSTSVAEVSQQVRFSLGHLSSRVLVQHLPALPDSQTRRCPQSLEGPSSPLPINLQLFVTTFVFLTKAVVFPALPCGSLYVACAVREQNAAAHRVKSGHPGPMFVRRSLFRMPLDLSLASCSVLWRSSRNSALPFHVCSAAARLSKFLAIRCAAWPPLGAKEWCNSSNSGM